MQRQCGVTARWPVEFRQAQQPGPACDAQQDREDEKKTHQGVPSGAGKKVAAGLEKPEVMPDCVGGNASAGRALQVTLLDQIGLENVFDGVAALANGGCEVVESNRASTEFFQH